MKPKLISMQVPWRVQPSVPDLGVRLDSEIGESIEVEFIGQTILPPPEGESSDVVYQQELIVVTFKSTYWMRTYPNLGEAHYDWSEVFFHPTDDIDGWLSKYTQQWLSSGIAPRPGFYQVQNSDWIPDAAQRLPDYKNYLFQGAHLSVEIFGNIWTWQSKRVIDYSEETEVKTD